MPLGRTTCCVEPRIAGSAGRGESQASGGRLSCAPTPESRRQVSRDPTIRRPLARGRGACALATPRWSTRWSADLPHRPATGLHSEQVKASTAIKWSGCGECGYAGAWPGDTTRCPECGAQRGSEEAHTLQLRLTFAVGVCETCEVAGPDGVCPSCGAVLEVPEPNAATRARVSALRLLLARATAFVESFATFPEAHIPVTVQQTLSVVTDADLPQRVIDLIGFAHTANELELESPAVIGRETRRRLLNVLDDVERVRDEARRLAAFKPPDDIVELTGAIAQLAVCGARVVADVIEVISAETLGECQEAFRSLQGALTGPEEAERLTQLLRDAPTVNAREDLDARASLAIGLEAQYSDELGLLDPVRIFAAAANEPSPMAALARGAGHYLSHLLDTPADELPEGAAVLAAYAVPLAVLDRPFGPHRQAELARGLLRQAASVSPSDVQQAISLYDEHQGRVFAAASRASRDLRLVLLGRVDEPVEAVESALSIYKRLAEGPYREAMRLLIAARAGIEGRAAPSESLLLGDIDGYLDGWHDDLGDALRSAVERDLRNAVAHEDFRIDAGSLEVVLPERIVSPEALEAALTRLTATIAALEAAILCQRLDARDELRAPEWLIRGDHPTATAMILQMIAGAYHVEIVDVTRDDEVVSLRLDGPSARDRQRARMLLVSAAPLMGSAGELRATADGELIAATTPQAVAAWQQADPEEQDLALIELLFDSNLRGGTPASDALADACAAAVLVISGADVPAVTQSPTAHTPINRLARRLRRLARFASAHAETLAPEERVVVVDLRAAWLAANAAVFDSDRLAEATEPLVRLLDWSTGRMPLPADYAASS
jgi:hypothetical protein